ncbi:hypothetical protein GALMADRAFT_244549 [Galerina marginata CBS 339.88]|uniref:Translocon-associated protein subunit alpha n=1 Tax=Galerina marginata (strain CBS 339.88) TaxID=685588 RepID=A0A067T6Z8_GALM3|nr:hypothetical protein GALMADRAFT_244549 [Galerina marginata CBS 339.88]
MRFGAVFGAALSFAAFTLAVSTSSEQDNGPEVIATAAFPETNAFNHVVNGEKNGLTITVENKSGKNVTLLSIAGSLLHPDSNVVLKNLTSQAYGIPLLDNVKLQIPYTFYSQFKPGDHRLNVWLEHKSDDGTYKVEAFDSIVTVVDPELSIFDLKLLSTYVMVAGILGSLVYLAYGTFVPQAKKTRAKKTSTAAVSAPVTVTATGSGGYQEEWIPEHHLRKSKSSKKQGALSGTSGDEFSGAETSGAEGKKRKGRK